MKYTPTIGLEIHAELKTKTKMFCRSINDPFTSQPNTNVCPVCLGMPGSLPVPNKQAIDWTILVGLALGCKINNYSKWDRKNYFYPDLPKGYQISQYDMPLCEGGYLEIPLNPPLLKGEKNLASPTLEKGEEISVNPPLEKGGRGDLKRIAITRVHLEEDTGKLIHLKGAEYSLVDYNRAGVPLIELVTEPEIETAQEAKIFSQEYQLILRYLGISDADMEKGQMRIEANISLALNPKFETNSQFAIRNKLGTKVEIKNLNSFMAVEKAIEYEIARQSEILNRGEKVIQETRGWNEDKGITFSQRTKEEAQDYRYFPEPDIPPLKISQEEILKIKKKLPILPRGKRAIYEKEYGLGASEAAILADDLAMMKFFEETLALANKRNAKLLANWIINEVPDLSVSKENLAQLINMIGENEISGKIAKEILPEVKNGKSPKEIANKKGLKQISSWSEIDKIVDGVLGANQKLVEGYKAGRQELFGFFVGQIMKETKGQANPQIVNKILKEKLK